MQDLLGLTRPPDRNRTQRVKGWVRDAFDVPDTVTTMVTELRCAEEGCPPRETVIVVMDPRGARQIKLPKGLDDLTEADVRALRPAATAD